MTIVGRMHQSSSFDFPDIELDPNWAENEFGATELGDPRRTRRFVRVMNDATRNPGKSIPEFSASWGDCKGLYRLVDCPKFTDEVVLEAHRKGTLKRATQSSAQVLLAIQDTTTLNFTSHVKLEGQGSIGRHERTTGLHLHNTLLVGGETGEIFGLLGVKLYARDGKRRAKQAPGTRNREPIEKKESYRWLESFDMASACHTELGSAAREVGSHRPTVVSVGDREADIYELLIEASKHRDEGLHLLVRSQHNRKLVSGKEGEQTTEQAEQSRLWEHIGTMPERGRVEVEVPRKGNLKKRKVTLSIRYGPVELEVPAHKRKYQKMVEPAKVNAILLVEEGGGKNAICWKLLTTLPVESVAAAAEIAHWYALRWQVEVLHRVLKTGCRVEDRQLRTMDRLRPMIAIDLVVSCHLMSMASAARGRPETPASDWLDADELDALCAYQQVTESANAVLTIGQAVRMIGKLGGHLGRKGDGPPGTEVIWRGLRKLETITDAWRLFTKPITCG
jgi:hypothetical protein